MYIHFLNKACIYFRLFKHFPTLFPINTVYVAILLLKKAYHHCKQNSNTGFSQQSSSVNKVQDIH